MHESESTSHATPTSQSNPTGSAAGSDASVSSSLAGLGIVVIGRNEGGRLAACLASIPTEVGAVVYVDSGSSDGSPERARSAGVDVVELDRSAPFSAARGRNAGFERIQAHHPELAYVHFVDGDCRIIDGWLPRAVELLDADSGRVAVCGRRQEIHPEASPYNRICDIEWRSGPAGSGAPFGGDVAIRASALRKVGGYDPSVVAAEDDELGVRLRRHGETLRVEEPMTLHDAAITRASEWWQRAIRCGHGYAQVGRLHAEPERYFQRERRRAWIWGGGLPALVVGLAWPTGGLSLLLLALPALQVARIARGSIAEGFPPGASWEWGVSCMASQPANLLGILKYHRRSRHDGPTQIIEYKGHPPHA